MKLAEALMERSDANEKIHQLQNRLASCCIVQQGEQPIEDPQALAFELDATIDRLETLMARINLTNCQTQIDGVSLTQLIARKDALRAKLSAYYSVMNEGRRIPYRSRGSEIKLVPTIEFSDLQKKIDTLSKEIRLVDNKLQMANWQTDLIED